MSLGYPSQGLSLTVKVTTMIEQKLSTPGELQAVLAAELGLHPRTLQRRLIVEDTRFGVLKDEVRRKAAWQYLSHTSLPLAAIASRLGYSAQSSFSRSCVRWFSRPPGKLRQAALGDIRR
jgi:AraC-like DNA-binding protein